MMKIEIRTGRFYNVSVETVDGTIAIEGPGANGLQETLFFSKHEASMIFGALRQFDNAGELED